MNIPRFLLLLPLLAAFALPASAQDVGRVSPASLPLPLPQAAPMPPDQLRAKNPWNLAMTGTWRFQMMHGRINKDKEFQPSQAEAHGITASTSEEKNPPEAAFDGSADTRWCAGSSAYPQWLQADLGKTQHVSSVNLAWENSGSQYQCRIEGRKEGGKWMTLKDASATPGLGDGPVTLTPADVRYVRITVLGTSGAGWASLREFQIRLTANNGQEVAWQPPAAKAGDDAAARDAFAKPTFDDATWDNVPVPSNWEMLGYSEPTYNGVDDTVGMYRRTVTVPAAWAGKRIYWHFDGALDGAEIFVNGQKAGYHESGYTAWNIDLTGLVKPGQPNFFAVRVSKSTPSSECETGDFQCMGGIYRDTSLIAVPQTHISDITVRTPLAANYKDATLTASIKVAGTPGEAVKLAGMLVGIDGQKTPVTLSGVGTIGSDGAGVINLAAPVKAPKLWSAEKPNLYYLVVQMTERGKPVERVEQRFGFRQIEIKNNIVLWNGMPIKCTGTCRHDYWADRGFALTEANWVKDLTMMKAANINAIRTSHYNHAQRFLELCEEKGMYILDEVPYCWIGDLAKDPNFAPYLLQRGAETLARDKNRPCVLAWSIGNENPPGIASQMVSDMISQADPTRPRVRFLHQPRRHQRDSPGKTIITPAPDCGSSRRQPEMGRELLRASAYFLSERNTELRPRRIRSVVGNADQDLGQALERPHHPRLIHLGMAKSGHRRQNHGQQAPGFVHPSSVPGEQQGHRGCLPPPQAGVVDCQDGLQPGRRGSANGQPRRWNLHRAADKPLFVHRPERTDLPLDSLECGGATLQTGVLHIACAPMRSVQATFPAPGGMTALRLDFDHPDGSSVVAANLAVDGFTCSRRAGGYGGRAARSRRQTAQTRWKVASDLQEIVFDKHTGTIQSWRVHGRDMLTGGPVLNLGEAKESGEKSVYRAKQPPVTDSAQVTASPGTRRRDAYLRHQRCSFGGRRVRLWARWFPPTTSSRMPK